MVLGLLLDLLLFFLPQSVQFQIGEQEVSLVQVSELASQREVDCFVLLFLIIPLQDTHCPC